MENNEKSKRLARKFEQLKKENKKGLIIYITAGDPDLDTTKSLVLALEESGADMIELGVPFSDPIADGPVIQKASFRALQNGVNLKKVLDLIAKIRKESDIPLAVMTYYNIIYQYGFENFVSHADQAGLDSVIIPDLPYEEGEVLKKFGQGNIELVSLIAPTSGREREKLIVDNAQGFIYCVSVRGITGTRNDFPQETYQFVSRIKAAAKIPVAVGFGISNASLAKKMAEQSDAVIVGSAIVSIIEELGKDCLPKVGSFVQDIKEAINN